MYPEVGVFQGDQSTDEDGIGAVEVGPQTPAAVLHRQGPQPHAMAVEHHGRGALQLAQRRGQRQDRDGRRDGGQTRAGPDQNPPPGPRQGHGAAATLSRADAVRALTVGRYMFLASAPGRKKSPGVTARAT